MEPNEKIIYRAIDLFCGLGGTRLGYEKTGRFETIFACDLDNKASQTYRENFTKGPDPQAMEGGDITKIVPNDIPDHDFLVAGFPCQPFSMAGQRKGFEDENRGNLFFNLLEIIKSKRPAAFLLENVKGLTTMKNADGSSTLETIRGKLVDAGYAVAVQVLNSRFYGVPQNRDRVYLVGFRHDLGPIDYTPQAPNSNPRANHPKVTTILEKNPVGPEHYMSASYLETLKRYRENNKKNGRGFDYKILNPDEDVASTLTAGAKGKENNLVLDSRTDPNTPESLEAIRASKVRMKDGPNQEFVRYITPREAARLQGLPERFKLPAKSSQALKQIGNSVTVPVIEALAREIVRTLDKLADRGLSCSS